MRQAALYICYYNVTEPLVETQVIAYLRELARRGIDMHLLTFERESHSPEKQAEIRSQLADAGIRWHALRYHQRPSLPATLYDIAVGTVTARKICKKYNINLVHARSHVPAAMALRLKRSLGCRVLFDIRGLLAEEYVDAGNWREGELKFRLTKRMESSFFRQADAFVMLTHSIKEELVKTEPALHLRGPDIEVIPCCVDTQKYRFTSEQCEAYRRERGWEDRKVITYVGKIGTWYLPDEMARFFAAAKQRDSSFFLQVLTQSDPAPMKQALEACKVSQVDCDIRFAPPDDLPLILSASHAGLSFIRATYSKRASSPTKVGEYLAAGLPVIANRGIGDCDTFLEGERLGVIVKDFSDDEYAGAADSLQSLLKEDGVSSRCRRFAEEEMSLSKVGGPRYAAIYESLLGSQVRLSLGQTASSLSQEPVK